jgi:tetratricopeptide (TPR) repeat protein
MVIWSPVSWGQLRSRSVTGSLNTISDMKNFQGSNSVYNLQSYGASAYQYGGQSYNNVLNLSNSYGSSSSRSRLSTGFSYGSFGLSPGISSGGFSTRLSSPFSSSSLNLTPQSWRNSLNSAAFGSGLRSMPSIYGPEQVMMPMMNDLNPIILLAEELKAENSYERAWAISSQEAIKPFMDKKLLVPNPEKTMAVAVESFGQESVNGNVNTTPITTDRLGLTTSQGEVYTAQQISMARNYIRNNKFDQALNCYQAARSVDPKNTNALIGIALCHIMTGKMQAGGLNIKFLAEQEPNFWESQPDFIAIFGISSSDLRPSINQVEPEVDQYLNRYQASDSKETAENLKLAYLAKMFLAWLKDDRAGMLAGIQAAADATPLDAPVQKLCRSIAGCQAGNDLELKPMEPIR